jgi:hypothetical protein
MWYRVDANYGAGWVLVGEANDRIGYLALADRAWKDGAVEVRIYRCEAVGGQVKNVVKKQDPRVGKSLGS